MNVLFCSPGLSFQADAPTSNRLRANGMVAAGANLTVLGFPPEFPSHGAELRFPYRSVFREASPATQRRWLRWRALLGPYWTFIGEPARVMAAGYRLARAEGYDLYYISHVEPWLFLLLVLCRRIRPSECPCAVMISNVFYDRALMKYRPWSSRLRGWLNQRLTRFLPRHVTTCFESRFVAEIMQVRPQARAVVVEEGYEVVQPSAAAAARTRLGLPVQGRVLLLFGAASRAKGADLLFEALRGIAPDFEVVVAGQTGGVYESSWGDPTPLEAAGWGGRLHILSRYIREEEMRDLFAACDALVAPYRSGYGSSSMNVRRAIEYGKAVMVPDQYWLGETVRQNGLGLLFEPDSVDSLRMALNEFAQRKDAWFAEVAERAATLVSRRSWTQTGREYLAVFESLRANLTRKASR